MLTGLNPWTVMAHFLLSMVLIALAVVLHQRAREGDLPARPLVAAPLRSLATGLLVLVAATLVVGTVVTGSGPHSGDRGGRPHRARPGGGEPAARRPRLPARRRHGRLLAGAAGHWRPGPADGRAARSSSSSQGVIGFVQYWTDLPVLLVGLHLVGACLVLVTAVQAVLALRDRGPLGAVPEPAAAARELAPA